MEIPEPVDYLTNEQLKAWREAEAGIAALEANGLAFSLNESKQVWIEHFMAELEVYNTHPMLHRGPALLINPATGAIYYQPLDILVEAE